MLDAFGPRLYPRETDARPGNTDRPGRPEASRAMTDLSDAIKENAQGPARAAGDEGSFASHPLPDQIAADQYLAGKTAVTRKHRGLRFQKISPPGTA